MKRYHWLEFPFVLAVHDRQIAEHGGLTGIRDRGAIESAIARPKNLAAYGDPDIALLGAAYAFGIAKDRGFADGDKRTAWIALRTFLAANGESIAFDPFDAIRTVEALAAGELDEEELARWVRERLAP